jgi:hypothetical protein
MKYYEEFISLGTQCNPGLSLRQLGLKKETYPFDWVRSNSKIIYDVLQNGRDMYMTFDGKKSDDFYTKHLDIIECSCMGESHVNYYGQYFTHYYNNTDITNLINKINRWFDRFYEVLNGNKKILFIHTHEEYIYHKKSRDDKNLFYDYLCKINDLLIEKYPNLKFDIINIDINNTFKNYKNIINLSITYDLPISDNSETHREKYIEPYRNKITNIIIKYLECDDFGKTKGGP